jgi:RNA polymerase-binding transcription factor DksA
MSNWELLESVEGLEGMDGANATIRAGALWEFLQGEKEGLCREICAAGPLVNNNGYARNERDPSDENGEQMKWQHREELEHRLRDIIDAQDRLSDGTYGRCDECGKQIEPKRLVANPAAGLCISCRRVSEPEMAFHTM